MAPQFAAKHVYPLIGAVLIALACMTDLGISPVLAGALQPTPDSAGTVWLCRPGQANDPCTASLKTTVIGSNGSRHIAVYTPAADPPIDCFYLYPNVSIQVSANANLHIDPQETAIAELEASPFSQDCRLYAPIYREDTGLDPSSEKDEQITKRSVLSAWHDYLLHYNHGREDSSSSVIPKARTKSLGIFWARLTRRLPFESSSCQPSSRARTSPSSRADLGPQDDRSL
jgi:Protein of unknown function (DUF3089)